MVWPVTKALSSLDRKHTAPTMSAAVPTRLIACIPAPGEQSAPGLQGRSAMLRQVNYQRVEERPETPRHLVLPGAEGTDLVQGELDEILPRRRRVNEPYHPVPPVTTPTERCLAAGYRRTSSIRSSA